jgi:hypothetical protein
MKQKKKKKKKKKTISHRNGLLSGECLKHLSCSRQLITTFSNTNVQAELLDADVTHGILLSALLNRRPTISNVNA